METVIKLKLSELTNATIEKLRTILRNSSEQEDPEVTILMHTDFKKSYFEELQNSIEQLKQGEVISFTMEELNEYVKGDPKK